MTTVIGAILLVVGALINLLAAVGLLRLPDFFMRMHAVTKAGVVGSGLILLGLAMVHGGLAVWVKVLIGLAFLLLTTPVAGHLLGRAAYVGGAPFWSGTTDTALSGILPRGDFEGGQGQAARRPATDRPPADASL